MGFDIVVLFVTLITKRVVKMRCYISFKIYTKIPYSKQTKY